MPEFLILSQPVEALQTLLAALPAQEPASEAIEAAHTLGRILAEDVRAPHPLPEFRRSTVDGYAVKARDTHGVSEALPGYLKFIGEVPMGGAPQFSLPAGACAQIHTGGMLPDGADAVIMLEHTQLVRETGPSHKKIGEDTAPVQAGDIVDIEIARSIAEGENVIRIGEDVAADQIVLKKGKRLRPAEIGGCMALGIQTLRIAIKPRIGIVSSGDEVVPPDRIPRPGQVRDINSYSLAALVERAGGIPVHYGIMPDNLKEMKISLAKYLPECDALIITAGSSASARDMTAEAISNLGAPGVLVHGVNIRPGKPTILAVCQGKAVIGLPGNPVSALVIGELFVVPVIEHLLGLKQINPRPIVKAIMAVNVPSQAGREDWVAVRLKPSSSSAKNEVQTWLAEPTFGKSNLIFSLSEADGLVRIPPDGTGISAGEAVEVVLMN